jgi:hypothetical protein
MGLDLIYPNLNLFQYHLRESLGDQPKRQADRHKNFLAKLRQFPEIAEISTDCLLSQLQNLQPDREFYELRPLLTNSPKKVITFRPQGLDSFYYPVQMGDTYGLQVNFAGAEGHPSALEHNTAFAELHKNLCDRQLRPANDCETFGETWLLTACYIPNDAPLEISVIAHTCAQFLDTPPPLTLQSQGSWLGGHLLEFWTAPPSYAIELPDLFTQHPHILVWLFPVASPSESQDIDKKIRPTYHHWLQLGQYRHKITFAYYQSLRIKRQLQSANSQISGLSQQIQNLSARSSLDQLRQLLIRGSRDLTNYSQLLQVIEDQQSTLEINLQNYSWRCQTMAQHHPEITPANLDFLPTFITKYGQKHLRQIQADRAFFNSGLTVLQNLNQTIQSAIQIAQAKNDQTTNLFIASFAVGIALSQLISSILMAQNPPAKNIPFYATSAFQQSLLWAAVFPLLLILLPWLYHQLRRPH